MEGKKMPAHFFTEIAGIQREKAAKKKTLGLEFIQIIKKLSCCHVERFLHWACVGNLGRIDTFLSPSKSDLYFVNIIPRKGITYMLKNFQRRGRRGHVR